MAGSPDPPGPPDWPARDGRFWLLRAGPVVALLVVGAALVVLADGVVAIIGWGVIGVAFTVAVALAFLEVGFSEDRARERESAAARRRHR
jgi:hypothetical protein